MQKFAPANDNYLNALVIEVNRKQLYMQNFYILVVFASVHC